MTRHFQLLPIQLLLIAFLTVCPEFGGLAFADGTLPRTLTVEQSINESLMNSPTVQKAEAAVGESRWRHFETLGQGFLPKVSANLTDYFTAQYELTSINFGAPFTLPGAFPTQSLALNLTVPIFDGLANVNKLRAASLNSDASVQEFDTVKFETVQRVRMAFYQALAAAQLKDVAEQNVKTLEDHLKEVDVQQAGGAATKYDTLRVSVQLNEARADAIDAEDNVTLTRKKLTQLLGLDADDRALVGELPTPNVSKVKNLELSGVPAERADILALDLRAQAADHLHSAQGAWLIPSVSLSGQYIWYNEVFENAATGAVSSTNTFPTAYNIGVMLTWNLFDGGVSLAQTGESSYQQIQAEKKAQEAKVQVPYDFAYWKRRFLSNADHYEARQLDVERSTESVRLAKEEERAGTRTTSEALDAELDLYRSKAGVVNAQVNAIEAQLRLELTLGRML